MTVKHAVLTLSVLDRGEVIVRYGFCSVPCAQTFLTEAWRDDLLPLSALLIDDAASFERGYVCDVCGEVLCPTKS